MSKSGRTIFLSVGDVSGDIHAANLVRALKRLDPSVRIVGIGGQRMASAGCELIEDICHKSTMFFQAMGRAFSYVGLIRRVGREIKRIEPDLFVPIDSPALNWHFCKAARKADVPITHYICPQVWAWGTWRIHKLRRLTDHVICLLPFEPDYLAARGVEGTFVGHPLFDHLPAEPSPYIGPPSDGAWRILLLPGSRSNEIQHHVPGMVATAEAVKHRYPKASFVFAAHSETDAKMIRDLGGGAFEIVPDRTHELMTQCHFALTASGTVTLEAAYFGLPMVVFYHVPRVGYLALHWLGALEHYSLVNILAGRELAPELMPWHGNPQLLIDAVLGQLDQPEKFGDISAELSALSGTLQQPMGKSTSEAAAEVILTRCG